jgi:hypothetical protein
MDLVFSSKDKTSKFRNTIVRPEQRDDATGETFKAVSGPLARHGYELSGQSPERLVFSRPKKALFSQKRNESVALVFEQQEDGGTLITLEGEIQPEVQRTIFSALVAN